MLPILHLNGYKISNPTLLGRMSDDELANFFSALHYDPLFVEGNEPFLVHQQMARALDSAVSSIQSIQKQARQENRFDLPPRWPVILLRTPKGWTGPKRVDQKPVENSWRSHELPLEEIENHPDKLKALEQWMKT